MRLDPPSLGRVDVKLVATGDEIRAHVVVANDDVRKALESHWPLLRDRLDASGVTVSSFDVRTDTSGRRPEPELTPRFDRPVPIGAGGAVSYRLEPGRLDVIA
jgi:hypothetical protein